VFVGERDRADCVFQRLRWSVEPGVYAANLARPMSVSPGGAPFARTECRPLRVLEETKDAQGRSWSHVSRYVDAVELVGWVSGASLADLPGDPECAPRRVWRLQTDAKLTPWRGPKPWAALPGGYTEVAPAKSVLTSVRADLGAGDKIHLLVSGQGAVRSAPEDALAGGSRCEDWTVAPVPCEEDAGTVVCGMLYRDARESGLLLRSRIGYRFDADGRVGIRQAPLLGCDDAECKTSRVMAVTRCEPEPYVAVAADADSISFVRDWPVEGTALWGFHRDDVQRWYLSHDACEVARGAAPNDGTVRASVHAPSARGCAGGTKG